MFRSPQLDEKIWFKLFSITVLKQICFNWWNNSVCSVAGHVQRSAHDGDCRSIANYSGAASTGLHLRWPIISVHLFQWALICGIISGKTLTSKRGTKIETPRVLGRGAPSPVNRWYGWVLKASPVGFPTWNWILVLAVKSGFWWQFFYENDDRKWWQKRSDKSEFPLQVFWKWGNRSPLKKVVGWRSPAFPCTDLDNGSEEFVEAYGADVQKTSVLHTVLDE